MAVGITSNTCSTISSISLVPQDQIRFRCTTDYSGDLIKRLYHADNLDVLNSLIKDESVCGKIDLIYIDPPYNTGKDFVYKDNFRDNIDNYLTITGQKSENSTGGGTN